MSGFTDAQLNALQSSDLVSTYAGKHGIPIDIARRQVQQESGGNPRAVSSAGAIGMLQLMPGTSRMLGVKDPYDPRQNLDGGFRYLAELKKRFGSWEHALAAYNWGPEAVKSWLATGASADRLPQETRAYVGAIVPKASLLQRTGERAQGLSDAQMEALSKRRGLTDAQLHDLQAGPRPQPREASVVQPPPAPQQATHAAVGFERSANQHLEYAKAHPVEVLGDLLGAAQRGVGGALYGMQHHAGLIGTLRQVGHDVVNADAQTVARETGAVEQAMHLPTHDVIDAYVNAHVPAQLRPAISALLKGGEDFAAQTLSDPLTYGGPSAAARLVKIPELARMIGAGLRGKQVAQAFHAAVSAIPGLKRLTPAFDAIAHAYDAMGQHYANTFHVRRELEPTFTVEGKQHFMQIEGRNLNIHAQNARIDEHAVRDTNTARERYLQYVYEHGDAAKSAQAAKLLGRPLNSRTTSALRHPGTVNNGVGDFLSGSPEERASALRDFRNQVLHNRTASQAAAYFGKYAAELRHPVGNWSRQLKSFASARRAAQERFSGFSDVTGPFRDLMRATIMLNILPHGLKNVGELAYYAGGIRVIPEALASMARSTSRTAQFLKQTGKFEVQSGIDQGMRDRLLRIGAGRPSYTSEPVHTIWSRVIPTFDRSTEKLQEFMGMMEESWRASLLNQLDRHLGSNANDMKAELSKGFIINDRLGDYRNQSAFVQLFAAMGGPWVAFRLGIVPKNVLRTIWENPRRVLAVIRAQEDIQHNRSQHGQQMNKLTFGGPTEDFSRLLANPGGFFTSPSTLGPLGEVIQSQQQGEHGEGLAERIGSGLESLNPTQQITQPVQQFMQGTGMPGPMAGHKQSFQRETLADRLMVATLKAFAVQFERQQSQQSLNRQKAHDRATLRREEQYLQNLLHAPWEPPPNALFK